MTPAIWLTSFRVAALPDLLDEYADQLRHLYFESPERVLLIPFAESSGLWQQAHNGRAFGPTLEVRWRRADTLSIEAQLLWELDRAPSDLPEHLIKWTASKWNIRFEPLPRPRHVLLADQPDAMLRCLDYDCEGIIVLTRLCDLVPLTSAILNSDPNANDRMRK